LQQGGDVSGIFNASQLNVRLALFNGFTNQFGGPGFTLSTDDCGLLFLASFVNNEGGTLSFLLGDLLRFDGSSEFRRERKMLEPVRNFDQPSKWRPLLSRGAVSDLPSRIHHLA
jgi:hypothetical protein